MNIGDKVILKPKTRHAENRINQHGNVWTVLMINSPYKPGQVFLQSQEETFAVGDEATHDCRWVSLVRDEHFDIEE